MYADEDDDMEDLEEEQLPEVEIDPLIAKDTQQQQTTRLDSSYVYSRNAPLTIVNYGHEEGALSPEAEKGAATGRMTYGELLQTMEGEFGETKSPGITRLSTPGTHATTPQSLEPIDQSEPDTLNYTWNELESAGTQDAVMISVEEQKDIDPLDKFLPPPPKSKCTEELQKKIKRFITLKKEWGRSFNADVRNRKAYQNPYFLLHAVSYQDIDQIGSCFSKDVFDPHGYDKSDFFDQIEVDMSLETERREQERKRTQRIDFAFGGLHLQPAIVIPTPKLTMPNPGSNAIAAGRSSITASTLGATCRDGGQNKKSKWDKV